jgi:hypothetical protein
VKLNLHTAVRQLLAAYGNAGKPIADMGDYDELHEKAVRSLAQQLAYYAESGPLFDPEGKYLCGDCALRKEPSACTHVTGTISMTDGSCMIWISGEPINQAVGQKLTQIESNYAERPQDKGFGCSRCGWHGEAKKADSDGRPSWCGMWGIHVVPLACCLWESGPDLQVAPGDD